MGWRVERRRGLDAHNCGFCPLRSALRSALRSGLRTFALYAEMTPDSRVSLAYPASLCYGRIRSDTAMLPFCPCLDLGVKSPNNTRDSCLLLYASERMLNRVFHAYGKHARTEPQTMG